MSKTESLVAGISWSYISGFFDGEGGITVFAKASSNALALKATVCQKSVEVLLRIRLFLQMAGIYSIIYTFSNGMNSLEVGRADDLLRFLKSLRSVVKARQVATAIKYLDSRISGNSLLLVYEQEYKHHKRKNSPLRSLGLRFPMTRAEAVSAARIKAVKGSHEENRRRYTERMELRVQSLPQVFVVSDIQSNVGVSKKRAQYLGKKMEALGLVRSHFERAAHRRGHAAKVFEKVELPKLISSSFRPPADAKALLSERPESEGRKGGSP